MTKSGERCEGRSDDPQIVDECCDRCNRARSLDRHWYCPGPRLWRRFWWRRVFTATGMDVVSTAGMAAAFTAGMVASTRAIRLSLFPVPLLSSAQDLSETRAPRTQA